MFMGKRKLKYKLKYYKENKSNVKLKKIILLIFIIFIAITFIFFFIRLFVISEFSLKIFHVNEKKVFQSLKVLYYSGDYEELSYNIDNYLQNKVIKTKSGIRDLVLLKIYLLNLKNDYNNSIALLKRYKKYFTKEEYPFLFSYLMFKKGDIESSLKFLSSFLQKQKKYNQKLKNNYILYSYLNYIQNNITEAIDSMKKIPDKDNNVYYNLAYLYFLNNNNELALKTLYKITDSQNLDLSIKLNLLIAKLLFKFENFKESNIYLDKIKDIGIDYDTYYFNSLLNSFYANDTKGIRKFYEIIKNTSFFYKFYSLLFVSSYNIGDLNNAKLIYDKYLSNQIQEKIKKDQLNDYDLINYLMYVDILINDNMNKIAINYIEKIINLNFNEINTIKIYKIYIALLIKENMLDKAKNIILEHKKILFVDKSFIKTLLDIYIKQGEYEDGINFIKKYYDPKNDTFEYYYLQGYLLRKIGNFEKSNEVLFNLLTIIADIKEKDIIYKTIAKNFIDLKFYEKANKYLMKINNKDDLEYLKLYFKNSFYMKDWDNLIIIGKRILLTEKNKSLIYFYIGYGYYNKKNYKQAIYYFKNSLETIKSKKLKANIAIYLGNSYGYLDDKNNSLFYFNEAKTIDPSNLYSEINIEKLNQGEKYGE